MLSGATGHVMGNFPIWGFYSDGSLNPLTDWKAALNSGGSTTLRHLRNLFEARAWWTLVPDLSNTFLTAGESSFADRAVAAVADDGSFAIVYTPTVRQLTIDPAQLTGPNVQAQWCDPTSGSCVSAGPSFSKANLKNLTPSGNNNGNFGDWVLLLESVQ
jgi:hypothetical protein